MVPTRHVNSRRSTALTAAYAPAVLSRNGGV
jgi:hypothetical protein